MKILVFSDSHSVCGFMKTCMEAVKPDAVIHLGDMVRDGEKLAQSYGGVPFFQVAGNCDRGRVLPEVPEILVEKLGSVKIYMTHGHLQGVKLFLDKLILDGQRCGADGATAGIISTDGGISCRIIRRRDLEETQ